MATGKKISIVLKVLAILAVLLLAGGGYFIYGVVPQKVAEGILAKAKVHKLLTQTPKDYGLKYEDLTASGEGVTLSGWWLPQPKPQKALGTILLTHGVFKNREQVMTRAEFLEKAGYQVLLFDQRGNGLSSDGPTSGGVLESGDFLIWTHYLEEHHLLKKPLVYFGFSLGSLSALRAVVRSNEVDGVIADSPLANLKSYVSRRTIGGKFASMPFFLGRCLSAYDHLSRLSLTEKDLDMSLVVTQLRAVPVLYFTGESDDLAKSDEVRKLFEKSSSHRKRLVYIPEAGHEETYSKYPLIYEKAVKEFLEDLTAKPKDNGEDLGGFPNP